MSIVTINRAHIMPQAAPSASAQRKIVIAVDGPAASGKGTLARMMASRLGYAYLDTGALYRAVALATLELGGNPENIRDVEPALALIKRNLTPELLAHPVLRSHAVSEASSKVAALPDVRAHLIEYQRAFAENPPGDVGGAVLDGRDIGTVICPDADLKFFVTASPEERARRRFEELRNSTPGITLEKALQDIQQRDHRDINRKISPMIAAPDARILDTTRMNAAEALEEAISVLRAKFLSASTGIASGS